ncbi:hypothetical protein [Micromonospora sp. WMMD1082]|uniref:hypothetical protein n=1 Tax=Micromonospora sp. WMMD1082 TaxID=3016104 RepID=UPI002416BB4C|nr:hypothetical protein [Micromonospora sp. WMMD1082]MDG4792714.1 hypothetical protein [Micromonospora sp. WMMD1082]
MSDARDELSETLVKTLRALRRTAAAIERAGREVPDDLTARRTALYREAAQWAFDLREYFLTAENEPDWSGRTGAYKAHLRDLYDRAGYSREDAATVQVAVRYHLGRLVRDRLGAATVTELGLTPGGYVERKREARQATLAELDAVRNAASSPDVSRAIAGALVVLQRVSVAEVAELHGTARTQARTVLSRLVRRAEELREAVTPEE